MLGTANIADKVPTLCFVLVQLRDGRFVRKCPHGEGHLRLQAIEPRSVKAYLLGG